MIPPMELIKKRMEENRIRDMSPEEKLFRSLLAVYHSCGQCAMHTDDGEMQCKACGVDFLRDSASVIEEKFNKLARGATRTKRKPRTHLSMERCAVKQRDN